jgi:hypothetical protein
MRRGADKRDGYSLFELLGVMAALTAVGGVLTLMLLESLALERTERESLERALRHKTLADTFRADVARAEAAPAEWREHRAGPQALILRLKEGGHVLYLWKDDRLERRVFADKETPPQLLATGDGKVEVEFSRDGAETGLVRLRLLTLRGGKALPGQALEIAAALGGDWR